MLISARPKVKATSRPQHKAKKPSPRAGPHVPSPLVGNDTLLGLPQTQRRTLAFAGTTTLTSTAGAYAEVIVPMNDAFNAFGGASAIGYAKYMAFYQKAFVLGSRLIIRGGVRQTGSGSSVVGVTMSSVASSFASGAAAIEAGLCQWVHRCVNPDSVEFSQSVEVGKFFNIPSPLTNSRLYSTSAASPADLIECHVFIDTVGVAVNGILDFTFELLLDVTFTDPIPFT